VFYTIKLQNHTSDKLIKALKIDPQSKLKSLTSSTVLVLFLFLQPKPYMLLENILSATLPKIS